MTTDSAGKDSLILLVGPQNVTGLTEGNWRYIQKLHEQINEKAIHRNNNRHNQILNAASFSTKRGPIEQTMKISMQYIGEKNGMRKISVYTKRILSI